MPRTRECPGLLFWFWFHRALVQSSAAVRTRVLIFPLALVLSSLGCQKGESNLAKMDEKKAEKKAEETPEVKTTTTPPEGDDDEPPIGDPPSDWPVDANGVPIPPLDGSAKLDR